MSVYVFISKKDLPYTQLKRKANTLRIIDSSFKLEKEKGDYRFYKSSLFFQNHTIITSAITKLYFSYFVLYMFYLAKID